MDELHAFPALPEQVSASRRWAVGLVPAEVRDTVELIVSELVTNAIVHGGADRDGTPGTVTVRLATGPGRLRITVTDPGGTRIAPPVTGPLAEHEHGRGLVIVAACADRSGVRTTHDHTRAWAEINLAGADHVDDQPPADPDDLHDTAPDPLCPGLGAAHPIETTSGAGGTRRICATCAPRPEAPAPPGPPVPCPETAGHHVGGAMGFGAPVRRWRYNDGTVLVTPDSHVRPPARIEDAPPEWERIPPRPPRDPGAACDADEHPLCH